MPEHGVDASMSRAEPPATGVATGNRIHSSVATWPSAQRPIAPSAAATTAARVRSRVEAYLVADGIPPGPMCEALEPLFVPLAAWIASRSGPAERGGAERPLRVPVIGISGAQGTGKTTVAELLRLILVHGLDVRCVTLSLDDLYLGREARAQLARTVHPLLRTRGVPGTHDVPLAQRVLRELRAAGKGARIQLPRFDKADDDRAPAGNWSEVEGPVDCVLFEGWCVGARAQSQAALAAALNALERDEDRDGRFRAYVNAQLAGTYATLFDLIDAQVFIAAPDLDSSRAWRLEQEHKLRARHGSAQRVMSDAEVARFVEFYERISRHMLDELPGRADVVLALARDHTFAHVGVRTP